MLVETELWPELLAACGARGIPVVLVNARVSDKSFRGYRAVRPLLRPLLAPVSLALAQDEQSAGRLAAMGVGADRVMVTGNVKFDATPPGAPPKALEVLRRLAGGRAGARGRLDDAGRGRGGARRAPEDARPGTARSSCWRPATRSAARRRRNWRPTAA